MTFLARWFRRNTHNPAARPSGTGPAIAQRRCSLHLESLEDRTLLSAGFHDFGRGGFAAGFAFAARGYEYENASTSGPAAHLEVIVPENVTAGNAFNVTVEAEDASNHLATGYTGTIHFSLGSTDAGATLPADYTFTASDHGKHTFQVTLSATGSQTITATDTTTSSITGQASLTVSAPGAVTHLGVFVMGKALTGFPTQVQIEALDANNQVVTGYTGTVHFTSSDSQATLPADYTFTAADNGSHVFTVTFGTAGKQSVTATDTATSSISGTASDKVLAQLASVTVDPTGTVTHFAVYALGKALAGSATPVLVVALDAANHAVADYTGTVHLTTSDGQATLPIDYTFTAADNGSHLFSVTLTTTGKQTITATDTSNSSITGSAVDRVFAQLARQHAGREHAGHGCG